MLAKKIKVSYRKAVEEVSACSEENLSEARQRRRYLDFVRFSKERIIPLTKGDKPFYAEVHKDLGYFSDMAGETKQALTYLKRAEAAYRLLKDNTGLAETYCLFGDAYRSVPDLDLAVTFYEKSTGYRGKGEKLQEARAYAYWGIGDVHRMRGDYKAAMSALDKSNRIFTRIDSDDGIGGVLWDQGYVYICRGEFEKAESIFLRILDLCDADRLDESHRCTGEGALADTYRLQGKIDEELFRLYRSASESMEAQEDLAARSWIFSTQALAHLQLNETGKAKILLLEADAYNQKANDPICMLWTYQAMGELHSMLGEYDKAMDIFLKHRNIAKRSKCKLELGHAYLGLAEVERNSGANPKKNFLKALEIYRQIGSKWGVRECRLRMKAGAMDKLPPLNFP